MKPGIFTWATERNIYFFLESPAPEVASPNNGLLKACSFSHMYFKEFLPLKQHKDKIFFEAQEEHKNRYMLRPCV